MQETPDNGTNSTSKCNATTGENIPNTLGGTQRQSKRQEQTTKSSQHVSGMNVSSVRPEPLPRYLPSELSRLTFKVGENRYQADDTEHTFAWIQFISGYAKLKGDIDWDDLEERAYFLNMLYEFCERKGKPFPLEDSEPENFNETFNAR